MAWAVLLRPQYALRDRLAGCCGRAPSADGGAVVGIESSSRTRQRDDRCSLDLDSGISLEPLKLRQ